MTDSDGILTILEPRKLEVGTAERDVEVDGSFLSGNEVTFKGTEGSKQAQDCLNVDEATIVPSDPKSA